MGIAELNPQWTREQEPVAGVTDLCLPESLRPLGTRSRSPWGFNSLEKSTVRNY